MKTDVQMYEYSVTYSADDKCFVARVLEWPSLAAHGDSAASALTSVLKAVAACVVDMEERGQTLPEPISTREFSGNLTLRMPPEMHRQLVSRADSAGKSLNQFMVDALEQSERRKS